MTNLPKRITAMRTTTYDVSKIVEDIISNREEGESDEVTLEEVMEQIEEWAHEDLTYSGNDITYLNENGEEL